MKSFEPVTVDKRNVTWRIGVGQISEEVKNGHMLTDWTLGRDLSVDSLIDNFVLAESYAEKCRQQILVLKFRLSWYCKETSLRGFVGEIDIDPDCSASLEIGGTIPGDRISGTVSLSMDVVVVSATAESRIKKGLKLGGVSVDIIIDGRLAQFPTQIISFNREAEFKACPNALYRLFRDMHSFEMNDLFYNTYTLYLNYDSPYVSFFNQKETKKETVERAALNLLISSVYLEILYDMSAYFKDNPQLLDEWLNETADGKRYPEMLGSVFYNIIKKIDLNCGKGIEAALKLIVSDPSYAGTYLQSSIFTEV